MVKADTLDHVSFADLRKDAALHATDTLRLATSALSEARPLGQVLAQRALLRAVANRVRPRRLSYAIARGVSTVDV